MSKSKMKTKSPPKAKKRIELKSWLKKLKQPAYALSVALTLVFLLVGVLRFGSSFSRFCEACRDLWTSYIHRFDESVTPTVHDLPKVSLQDLGILPDNLELFKLRMQLYGKMLIDGQTLTDYGRSVFWIFYQILLVLLVVVVPLVLLLFVYKSVYGKVVNNEYNKDTKPLLVVKFVSKYTYVPVKRGICAYVSYIKEKSEKGGGRNFLILWAVLWAFYFNAFTIIIELVAFVYDFSLIKLYVQFYKLFLDLSVVIVFFPAWGWVIIGLIVFHLWRHSHARKKIEKIEKADEEYVAKLPIATLFVGPMGTKKTTTATDVAITLNKRFRDKSYELLLDNDLKFPNFPWINLERCIKAGISRGTIFNLATCRQMILRIKMAYAPGTPAQKKFAKIIYHQLIKCYDYDFEGLFGYDIARYGDTVYDNQKQLTLFQVLETYSQLYFIYIVSSSLLISNYAVRIDDYLEDKGNFPLWNIDFFRRDAKEIAEHTHYSHRLDFDALRLGTRFIKGNKFRNSIDFGIILITEIGKERGNQKTIKFCYAPNGANPDMDLMSMDEKLVRHRGTVDNFPFVAYIADEQRAASLNLNEQDLFDVCRIDESTDFKVAMPLFALDELIYLGTRRLFEKFYKDDRYYKGNNGLLRHLIKSVFVVIHRHYVYNIFNLYAVSTVDMTIQDMRDSKDDKRAKYKLIKHKIHAGRFDTACWGAYYYEKTKRSTVGIGQIPEYRGLMAQFDELDEQHSYVAESMKRYVLGNDRKSALSDKRKET